MVIKEFPAAYWQETRDEPHRPVTGQNCTKYLRLEPTGAVSAFRLKTKTRAWGTSNVLAIHIRHLRISVSHDNGMSWQTVFENDNLPKQSDHLYPLGEPVTASFWKVEALTHHGMEGGHVELASNPRCVLWTALEGLSCVLADGTEITPVPENAPALIHSPLPPSVTPSEATNCVPGVSIACTSNTVVFENHFLKVGFSRLRPMMTFLGWDSESTGRANHNFLNVHGRQASESASGPWLAQVTGPLPAALCGGQMRIEPNGVTYDEVEVIPGLKRRYTFTVESDALWITIHQKVDRPVKAIECEAWRWVWNLKETITATLAQPVKKGKNGRCQLPAILHAPNFGHLALELIEGDPTTTFLKVDSWRDRCLGYCGIECGSEVAEDGELLLRPGVSHVKLRLSLARVGLAPAIAPQSPLHPSYRRAWANAFGFRPEYFGMSNNAASLNCHFVQHGYTDLAYHTATSLESLSMIELCGYSIELALCGGMGYGENRDYFLDSDASLLMAAGTYLAKTRNETWARKNRDGLLACGNRLLEKRLPEGLIASRLLSGNSGERHWSTNWWDVLSFGHLDAFVNAFVYRGFRQLQHIGDWLDEPEIAQQYREAADQIKSAYFPCFYNPQTEWLAGWRSRDGELHDYGFLFVNGAAIVHDLVPEDQIRPIMERLEAKRKSVGFEHFQLGLPGNLLPIRKADYAAHTLGAPARDDGTDTWGCYMNGGVTMSQAYFYIRALGIAGMPDTGRIGRIILDAFEKGEIVGGLNGGNDWCYWDGSSNGYEGMLTDQFYVLLAVAQNEGLVGDIPYVGEKG